MSKPRSSKKPAAAIAVSLFALASAGKAAVVCDNVAPILVPQTTAGIYINLVTGVSNTVPGSVPGWDFNPWSATGATFWLNNSADPAGNPDGSVADSAGGNLTVLAAGATIDGTRFFSDEAPPAAEMINWRTTHTGQYLGVRFYNESTASTNYGWIQLDTVSPTTGLPVTVQSWCYEDSGAGITAGTVPVELQNFSVE